MAKFMSYYTKDIQTKIRVSDVQYDVIPLIGKFDFEANDGEALLSIGRYELMSKHYVEYRNSNKKAWFTVGQIYVKNMAQVKEIVAQARFEKKVSWWAE